MKPFDGLSILLLEDEYLIALDAEQILKGLGVKNVEVVNTLAGAAKAAFEGHVNLAVLDVNINGEMSFPIAEKFHQQGTPVVFASGYEMRRHPVPQIANGVCLVKPYTGEMLKEALLAALSCPGNSPP
jgi:DNA-binding response OmpR family regulator